MYKFHEGFSRACETPVMHAQRIAFPFLNYQHYRNNGQLNVYLFWSHHFFSASNLNQETRKNKFNGFETDTRKRKYNSFNLIFFFIKANYVTSFLGFKFQIPTYFLVSGIFP